MQMKKSKLMIVDDSPEFLILADSMLADHYEIITASSGSEGLALYEKERPDLILVDLIMPQMTGAEMLYALQDRFGRRIPAIIMTADSDDDSERIGLESGAMDYVRKPFQKAVLLSRIQNILQNEARIRALQDEARIDTLTGLLNKAYSQDSLREVCRKDSGVLMLLDLDSFKLVNDIYGHGMGDQVLTRFAGIIRSNIRPGDLAGRIGGDEFIVFCNKVKSPAIVREKAANLNRMIAELATALLGKDCMVPLGVSVGAVFVPEYGSNYDELATLADKALYRVKQNGKHGCHLYDEGAGVAEPVVSNASLMAARMSLEERSERNDAYELSMDNFRIAYRFLRRATKNMLKPVQFVLFHLSPLGMDTQNETVDENTLDCFAENMGTTLRRSDVYTQSGPDQFLLLLPEATRENGLNVIERVLTNFSKTAAGPHCSVTYEIDDLDHVDEVEK